MSTNMANSEKYQSGSVQRTTRVSCEQQRIQKRQARYERAFLRSGTNFRMWWLKLLGRMTTVVKTITNSKPARRRRSQTSTGGLRTQFAAAYESLEPKLLLTADITGINVGTYYDSLSTDTAVTSTALPTLSGTAAALETVTLTYKDANGVSRTDASSANSAGAWSIPLTHPIIGFSDGLNPGITFISANSGQDELKLTLDEFAPTVEITSNVIGIANGDVTFTFTFNEPVTDFEFDDITLTGGTAVALQAISDRVYTLEVTPSASVTEITVDVIDMAAQDAAGNKSAANSATVAVDVDAPTVMITTDPAGPAVANGPVTFTFLFSEPVTGFFPSEIQVIGGSPGNFQQSDVDGAEYTLVVTPTANSSLSITVNLSADVAFDVAGNGNVAAVEATQEVDTIRPGVTITDDTPGVVANANDILNGVNFTITFTEDVTDFDDSDVFVSGGTIASVTGGPSLYTLTVIPDPNTLTPITVNIAANVADDPNGNKNTAAAQVTKAVDTIAPTVTITDNKSGTANGPVTFTFKFSENVGDSFIVDDVALSGIDASKGTFTKINDTFYTLVVIPGADQVGTLTVTVPAAAAQDLAGNDNVEKSATQAFQTTAPFIMPVTSNKPGATNGPVTFTFTFSEKVSGFTSGGVIVTGGAKTSFAGSGKIYTLVVTPTNNSETPITVNVPAGVAFDVAGNGNMALANLFTQAVDTKKPTVEIKDNVPGIANANPITNTNPALTFTFQFSENVTGFDASDVTVTGGTKGTFTPTPNNAGKYTLIVTPTANSTTPITVRIAENRLKDVAGNNNDATVTVTQAVDTVVPTLVITDNKPGVTNGPVTFTFTFSENVTGFIFGDVDVTGGGSKGALIGGGRSYSMVVTPPADSTTPIMVTVASGKANDLAGNLTTAASVTQTVDTVAPTLMITDSVSAATTNGQDTFTFNFIEPVTGFTSSDIVVTGGTKGTFTGSGASYTLVVTPFTESTAPITVAVAAGVANDLAGNLNKAGNTVTQGVDTKKPTVTISDDKTGTTNGPVIYTFVFSESVTGFEVGDVVVSGGTKGDLEPVPQTNNYTLIVTPNANSTTPINVSVPAGVAIDAVGNLNTAAAAATQLVDTAKPVLTITDNKPGITNGPVTFTFKFSENVTGFMKEEVTINNESLPSGFTKGALTGSGQLYSMIITPPAGSIEVFTVSVADDVALDAATNGNIGVSAEEQAVDRKAPTPTITSSAGSQDNKVTVATGPVTFRFEFDETVTGFTSDDIVITNGSRREFSAFPNSDGTIYELLVFPNPNMDGILKVSIAANAAFDAAGNGSVAASFQHTLSTKIPTVVITDNKPGTVTAATGDITYTFTFSEDVGDSFTIDDISVTNGVKGTFTKNSNNSKVYTLVVTPAKGVGLLTVAIAAGSFADVDGNLNSVLTSRVKSLFN